MTGSTPIYALPYPTGTDLVRTGDNTIQALAERTEGQFAGLLGRAQSTASLTGIGATPVLVTGLSFTVTVGTNRYIQVTTTANIRSPSAVSLAFLHVYDNGALLGEAFATLQVGAFANLVNDGVYAIGAGSHTFDTRLSAGSGSIETAPGPTRLMHLAVMDVGDRSM